MGHNARGNDGPGVGQVGALARTDEHAAPCELLSSGVQPLLVLGVRNGGRKGLRACEAGWNYRAARVRFIACGICAAGGRRWFVRSGLWALGDVVGVGTKRPEVPWGGGPADDATVCRLVFHLR